MFRFLGQFFSNYKGWRFHTWRTLTSEDNEQKPEKSDVALYFIVHLPLGKNIQLLGFGQFSVTKRDRGFIFGIRLHLRRTNRNQRTVSDVDLYYIVHFSNKMFSYCS